jgi:hypothetical protein
VLHLVAVHSHMCTEWLRACASPSPTAPTQGGELRVRHGGEEVVWDTSGGDTAGAGLRYAAFFADCEHTLSAVKSGLRLVLAYNLVRTEPMAAGGGGSGGGAQVEEVRKAVRVWAAEAASRDAIDGGEATNMLLRSVDLEHRYTEANLSFGGLKVTRKGEGQRRRCWVPQLHSLSL